MKSASNVPSSPIRASAPTSGYFLRDASASLVVFLVALPLCMGIALASGMPPASGLVTGIVGGLVVGAFSGSPLQVSGPAAGLAVIVFELVREHGIAVLGPIVILAGAIQLVAGLLKAGRWFRAISPEVIHGMLAGIGVLIVIQQFHVVLDRQPEHSGIANIRAMWDAIFGGLLPLNGSKEEAAAAIGLLTVVVMMVWEKWRPAKLKLLPGALLGILSATIAATALHLSVNRVSVPAHLSEMIHLPSLGGLHSISVTALLGSACALAFIASAETLLSAGAVDRMQSKTRTNYDRELAAQGAGNLICGLLGALPMTGVIVRSSTNVMAGAETRRSTIMHGAWILLTVAALPFALNVIPTASLAAVLIYVGIKLIKPAEVRKLSRFGKGPVIIYFASMITIVATNLLTGVMVGVILSLFKLLHTVTHLETLVVEEEDGYADVYLRGVGTFFGIPKMAKALDDLRPDLVVRLHSKDLRYIDHACIELIEDWVRRRQQMGQPVHAELDSLHLRFRTKVSEAVSYSPEPVLHAGTGVSGPVAPVRS